jgi:putative membrane protein
MQALQEPLARLFGSATHTTKGQQGEIGPVDGTVGYFTAVLPHFFAYFGVALLLAGAFLTLYIWLTPHRELELIRSGNSAAAVQLTGTFVGFAIPVAMVIGHSVSIPDMLLWGAVAAIVQLAVFVVIARLLFRGISSKIDEGCTSSGIFVGGMGVGIGVLQAACMVP